VQPLSLQQLIDRARAAGQQLPAEEAGLLFAAAVRLAAEQGAPLRPSRLLLLMSGAVALASRDEGEDRPGYLAPELAAADPPRRTEGRVQVFAAGALGYELLCGRPPPELPATPGAELHGPLGDVVRVALSADRRERFGDLQQLLDAIEVVQPGLGADPRAAALLSALCERAVRWEAVFSWPAVAGRIDQLAEEVSQLSAKLTGRLEVQEQALARLPPVADLAAHVADLEHALVALRSQQQAAQAKLLEALQKAQAQRTAAEERARDEAETREAFAALHPPKPAWLVALLPALLGGLVGAAAVAAFFVFGGERGRPAAPAQIAAAPAPAPVPVEPPRKQAEPAAPVAPAAPPAPTAVASAADAGIATGASADKAPVAAAADAGPPAPAAAAPSAAPSPAPAAAAPVPPAAVVAAPAAAPGAPAAKGSGSTAVVSPQRMARAVALSQVARGDTELEKGRADAAIEQFRTAIENDPDLPEAHRGLGMAYALRNLDQQAKHEYERYLALAPGAEDADDIRKAIAELSSRSKLGDSPK
jgi:tetratricopeptide (TPR) repeat protein